MYLLWLFCKEGSTLSQVCIFNFLTSFKAGWGCERQSVQEKILDFPAMKSRNIVDKIQSLFSAWFEIYVETRFSIKGNALKKQILFIVQQSKAETFWEEII